MNTEDTGRTPGRAAFEAWEAALIEPPAARMKWDRLTGGEDAETYRAAWEAAAQAAIGTSPAEDPQAELAALHELLAAIITATAVPIPADAHDMPKFHRLCARRLDLIGLGANVKPGASALFIHTRAQAMAETVAEPLPYEAEEEQP